MNRLRDERGVALLMVVLVVVLLSAVIVEFSYKTRLDSKLAENIRDALLASALARSGYDLAVTLLLADAEGDAGAVTQSGVAGVQGTTRDAVSGLVEAARQQVGQEAEGGLDTLQDAWARTDLLTLELDEAQKLKVKVTDLSGRINLNRVIKRDDKGAESLNKPVFEQLVTLIDQALLEMDRAAQDSSEELSAEEIAYAIADWVDSDESRLSDGSFEDQSYNSRKDAYSSKNGPFDSVAELQLVEGIDDAVYAAIRNAVTVYPFEGTDAINVNTAPEIVLRSIRLRENQAIKTPEPLSEEHIERILEARADEIAIASQLELRGLLGLDAAAIFTPRLTFGSDVFAIESVAKTNKTIARLQTVVERGNGGARVLYWRMD